MGFVPGERLFFRPPFFAPRRAEGACYDFACLFAPYRKMNVAKCVRMMRELWAGQCGGDWLEWEHVSE